MEDYFVSHHRLLGNKYFILALFISYLQIPNYTVKIACCICAHANFNDNEGQP